MSDELRAAAEKIRDLSGDVHDCLSGGMPHDTLTYRGSLLHELMESSLVLLKNYLSEHPADDDSAIAPEWLESIGLYRDGFVKESPYTHRDSSLYFKQSRVDNSVWDVFVEVYDLGTVRTRGDVRRLLVVIQFEMALEKNRDFILFVITDILSPTLLDHSGVLILSAP